MSHTISTPQVQITTTVRLNPPLIHQPPQYGSSPQEPSIAVREFMVYGRLRDGTLTFDAQHAKGLGVKADGTIGVGGRRAYSFGFKDIPEELAQEIRTAIEQALDGGPGGAK